MCPRLLQRIAKTGFEWVKRTKVVLTLIGGGVFDNPVPLIWAMNDEPVLFGVPRPRQGRSVAESRPVLFLSVAIRN